MIFNGFFVVSKFTCLQQENNSTVEINKRFTVMQYVILKVHLLFSEGKLKPVANCNCNENIIYRRLYHYWQQRIVHLNARIIHLLNVILGIHVSKPRYRFFILNSDFYLIFKWQFNEVIIYSCVSYYLSIFQSSRKLFLSDTLMSAECAERRKCVIIVF